MILVLDRNRPVVSDLLGKQLVLLRHRPPSIPQLQESA
jgi:hypothetical protein